MPCPTCMSYFCTKVGHGSRASKVGHMSYFGPMSYFPGTDVLHGQETLQGLYFCLCRLWAMSYFQRPWIAGGGPPVHVPLRAMSYFRCPRGPGSRTWPRAGILSMAMSYCQVCPLPRCAPVDRIKEGTKSNLHDADVLFCLSLCTMSYFA